MERKFISGLVKLTNIPDNHWKKGTLFLVIANRWGNSERHSYPVGVYRTLDCAVSNAHKEACYRGGKYGLIIYATQHTNKYKTENLIDIYELESPYKNKVK